MVELIEAAARTGNRELVADALGRLSQTTAASGTDWAVGIEARAHPLYGEWLRRERRRLDAREQLRTDYHLRKAFRRLGVKSRHQLKHHPL